MINKTDLAAAVGADLAVMERDALKMRDGGPFVFAQVRTWFQLFCVIFVMGDLESERANACLGGRLSTEKEWTRSLTTSCGHGRRQLGKNATDDPIMLFREKSSLLHFWSDRRRCFVFLYHAIKESITSGLCTKIRV